MAEPHTKATDPEDPAVVAAARAGDPAALKVIFDAYKRRVAHCISRMTGDNAAVDDLVQEVFVSAFAALPRFRGDAKLRTWLNTIAVNHVRNWWVSQRRRRRGDASARASQSDEVAEAPDVDLEARRHREQLYVALGRLPDNLREAFTARAIEGMELREASAVLKVPISTVSWRTRRAERMLCEALGLPPPSDG